MQGDSMVDTSQHKVHHRDKNKKKKCKPQNSLICTHSYSLTSQQQQTCLPALTCDTEQLPLYLCPFPTASPLGAHF